MASVKVRDAAGGFKDSLDLDEAWFGIEPNVAVMHQVVTAQLAARRSGTQSTKTRAEVRGGGAKPWKQKGTGRARQGSIRSPQWKGGGVALGPKPRSYAQRTPKKMIRLALRSALSDRAAEDKIVVLDEWGFDAPSTKQAAALLGALGLEGRVVVVVGADEAVAVKSFRNLPEVHLLEPGELNAYDILVSDYVVFTRDNLPSSAPDGETAVAGQGGQARGQGHEGDGQGHQAGRQGHEGAKAEGQRRRRRPAGPLWWMHPPPPSPTAAPSPCPQEKQEGTPTWPATCPAVPSPPARPPSPSIPPSGSSRPATRPTRASRPPASRPRRKPSCGPARRRPR